MRRKIDWPSRDELVRMYVDEHLTTHQIASKIGVAQANVWRKMVQLGIPRRANGDRIFTPEILAHMRAVMLGKKHSDETKEKCRLASLRRRPWTDEDRKKYSAWYKGRSLSEEQKHKISATMKAKRWNRDRHPCWKGGRAIADGRVKNRVELPNGHKYINRSRLIMAAHLGRPLLTREIVHHINHDRSDDRIENLMICTRAQHARLHATERKCADHGPVEQGNVGAVPVSGIDVTR